VRCAISRWHSRQCIDGAITILNISGIDKDEDLESAGIGYDMPLPAFDLLARIIAGSLAAFRCFDDWLSRTTAVGEA